MSFLMKYFLKKPILVALLLSLMSYCIYVTISSLGLIYLEIISISLIGFLYILEFKEPMPRDLRLNISVYFVIFSIIIQFTNDTYDLLKHFYISIFSDLSALALFLGAIFIKEIIKSPLLFGLTYIFLYISGRIYQHLNKLEVDELADKRILQEPFILAILLASIYIILVPVSQYDILDLYRFVLFEATIMICIGTIYAIKFKEIMPNNLRMQTAIYFSIITLIIYVLNYTHNYFFETGNNILDGKYILLSTHIFFREFINNLYFDTYTAITFLRFATTYTFLDVSGKSYIYLKNKLHKVK